MSETNDAPKPKKKGGRGKKMLMLGGAFVLLGGGGAGAAIVAGKVGLLGGHDVQEPDRPQLVPREGVSHDVVARYASPDGNKRVDPSKFQPSYYPLEDNFTANLSDSSGMVQASLGVSTFYDERVIENVKLHEMAVRSAILMALSQQDSYALASPEGKEALKAELRKAINAVLKSKEGFGGIDEVYFTSLVVQ